MIQSTLLFAAHEHSRLTTTDTIPLPPLASIVGDPAVAVTAQRLASAAGDGEVTLVEDDWHAANDSPDNPRADRRIANTRARAAYRTLAGLPRPTCLSMREDEGRAVRRGTAGRS